MTNLEVSKIERMLRDVVRLVNVLTVLYMIGCSKMNERQPDMAPYESHF